jgi:hypothetical protein
MLDLSELSRSTLSANGASELVVDAAIRMTKCIRLAGEDTATSIDEENLFDDATARGGLLYRRARNRIITEFEDDDAVVVSTSDNALHVLVDDCALSFYSAREGLDQPHIGTTSRTKKSVVTEMQMQLVEGFDVAKVRRLVLLHETDEEGLTRAALGVLRAGSEWVWNATMYNRFESTAEVVDAPAERGYEQQEEAALPPIERRTGETTETRDADENLAS